MLPYGSTVTAAVYWFPEKRCRWFHSGPEWADGGWVTQAEYEELKSMGAIPFSPWESEDGR